MAAELETEVMSESDIEKFWKGVLVAVPSITPRDPTSRMRNFWQGGLYDVNVIGDDPIPTLITSLEGYVDEAIAGLVAGWPDSMTVDTLLYADDDDC